MDAPFQRRNTLRLSGIMLSDYVPIDDAADKKFLEDVSQDEVVIPLSTVVQTHEKIPALFTGLDDWPLSTGLCCWSCGFTFAGRPKFIPTSIQEMTGGSDVRITLGVRGNFCTWGCAELWILTHYKDSYELRLRLQDNLRHAYFLFTGQRVSQISPAIPVTELVSHGGDLSVVAWQQRQRELEPVPRPVAPAAPKSAPRGNSIWQLYGGASAALATVPSERTADEVVIAQPSQSGAAPSGAAPLGAAPSGAAPLGAATSKASASKSATSKASASKASASKAAASKNGSTLSQIATNNAITDKEFWELFDMYS